MKLTLAQWFALDDAGRSVVLDQLLERVPAGYIEPRAVGHRQPQALPQFIHQATGMLFNVVFGGVGVMGMSTSRFERVRRVRFDDDGDPYLVAPLPDLEHVRMLQPAQPISVGTAMVCDMTLPYGVMRKLGLDDTRLAGHGVSPLGVGEVRKALATQGWRAPFEAEWEFVCRSVDDAVDALTPPLSPSGRLAGTGLDSMGLYVELCGDTWSDALLPVRAGDGHEVLRGRGDGARFVGWRASKAWSESVWPGRHRLAQWRDSVAVRPWVDLL